MSQERTLRILIACAAAALLGGCNQVYSEKPLFTVADEAGAPPLRPGLWRADDPKCHVTEARPVQDWPHCASWVLVRPGEILEFHGDERPPAWQSISFVLATGDPRILQMASDDDGRPIYWFTAVKPLRLDDQGRIVAFTTWPVQCGPPPTEAEPGPPPEEHRGGEAPAEPLAPHKPGPRVTRHPLPGLEVRDDNCLAREQGPVRAAAVASKAWENDGLAQHWVRDTLP
jgi:hypothetical protein